MLVFRVEMRPKDRDAIGCGAFGCELALSHDSAAIEAQDGGRAYTMPTPLEEPEQTPVHKWIKETRGYINEMRFGFESIQSYRKAFSSAAGRQRMAENGGVLSVYEVPREHVLIGWSQVVFDYTKSKRVAVLQTTDDYYAA
jgi:hypothetical protein